MTVTSSGPDPPREQPLASLLVLERLGQQLVQEQDLDAARAHQVDERVELLPRAPHPDDVVEEQIVAVARREPLVRQVGPVHHHRVELPDLRVCSEDGVGDGAQGVLLSSSAGRGDEERIVATGRLGDITPAG